MRKILLTLSCLIWTDAYTEDLSFYQQFTTEYCAANPYNCKSDGSIVGVAVDDFFRKLYLEVDKAFANYGFTDVQFEYCRIKDRCYRLIDNEETEPRVRWTNDNYVSGGPYAITKQYPPNRSWYAANGGVNRDLGIHFYKTLSSSEYDRHCTVRYKTGKALNRNIELKENMAFSNVYDFYKEEFKVLYRVFLNNLVGFDPIVIPSMNAECLIVDSEMFIPTPVGSWKTSSRIRRKTVVLYGNSLVNATRE